MSKMSVSEVQRLASAMRKAFAPVGRYQPLRVGRRSFPGWNATSAGKFWEQPFEPWLTSLGLDRLALEGVSAMELGCNTGSACFEVSRAGARSVVGVDQNARVITYARLWAALLRSDPLHPVGADLQFEAGDLMDAPVAPVDVLLCLSVFHHLRKPAAAMARLAGLAKQALVLEIQTPTPEVPCVTLDVLPESVDSPVSKPTYGHGWFPTASCIEASLAELGFSRVVTVGPGRVSGRVVLHAHR